MLSVRPHTETGGHQGMPLKTPAKASTSNTLGFNTIMRTNLKENTTNRAALLKTAPRSNVYPSTPGLKKSTAGAPAFSIFKEATLLGTNGKNTTKMPRLLDLTNKTPFINHNHPDSPNGGAFGSPLKAPFQLALDEAPETIIRPSRARTSLRMPRISGGGTPSGLPPVTPAPKGRGKHWEILDDGGDLSVDEVAPEDLQQPSIPFDDEIEYMPPPVVELPYDPGFDMPDYKEIGASIWKIGNIIDLTTLVGSRPPENPFVLEPEDIPSFDSILQIEPYVREEPDLTTFIGSKNLYARFEKPPVEPPASSVKTTALPSASRSSKLQPATAPGAGPSRTRAPPSSTTAGPRVPAARAAKASAPPPATAGLRQVAAHSRTSSRATSALNSSLATVQPPATSRAPSATTATTIKTTSAVGSTTKAPTTSRFAAPPVTRRRVVAAPSNPPVTASKLSRPTTRSTSATTPSTASRTGATPGRVTRQTSGAATAGKAKQLIPVPVVIAEEDIIEEDLMVPQNAFDDFDFNSLLLTGPEEVPHI